MFLPKEMRGRGNGLKAGRDNAKQKIISLLEKIEQVEI